MTPYLRQLLGFFKASFKALLRTPAGWLFGFLFPVIFVLLFGFISSNNDPNINVGILYDDSTIYAPIKSAFENLEIYTLTEDDNLEYMLDLLEQGKLDGVIRILPGNSVRLYVNQNQPQNISVISQTLEKTNTEITYQQNQITDTAFKIEFSEVNSREARYIDFVLPGILGYSIMSSTVFGVAFSFLTLRKENVLKRLFAGPARVSAFILGESFSRGIFILLQNLALILIAALTFGYSPRDGFIGYLNSFVVLIIGLLVFLGFGYLVAGFAKSDEVVSPLANLIVIPQFILAGTFFPVSNLPNWLSFIARLMPLYHFNESMRKITLEGGTLMDLNILGFMSALIFWGIVAYYLASRVFKVN